MLAKTNDDLIGGLEMALLNSFCGHIYPTDIHIFYEDGDPFLYYKGTTNICGGKYEIEIPKMDMVIHRLEEIDVPKYYSSGNGDVVCDIPIQYAIQHFSVGESVCKIRPIKKKMSKKDIEKELGYKIDIVESDE